MTIASPELHPNPVVSPWYHVGIDFICLLLVSSHGKLYILMISDYFTNSYEHLQQKHDGDARN